MNNPVVSVCMPVWNGMEFLERAFECLAQQTLKDFELVIVDDGSTDNSAAKAEELMAHYGLVGRVIRTSNHGPEQARDTACMEARADFLAPFDCDDQWEPSYLESMTNVLKNSDVELVYCDFVEQFTETGRVALKSATAYWIDLSQATYAGNHLYTFKPGLFFGMLLNGQVLFPPCTVFRRELFLRAGGYAADLGTLRISLDWYFGLRASRIGAVGFLKIPLLRKFVHGKNVSGNPLRTTTCDIIVLRTLLRGKTLTKHERRVATKLLSVRCHAAAYTSWATHRNHAWALKFSLFSLLYQWNRRAMRTAILALVPFTLIDLARRATGRTLEATPQS